jgi:hypothetical protein
MSFLGTGESYTKSYNANSDQKTCSGRKTGTTTGTGKNQKI